jgi:hypothetical protein
MSNHLEPIHTADNDPKWHMPYTPAIKIHAGKTVYIAGVTAVPVYHSHPHMAQRERRCHQRQCIAKILAITSCGSR